ncbi:hypothetical protein PQE75_gp153 [Bacillus phage vB_BcoS-136]|uniref:Uncharacterized protein n=1 Tax=Bacillus phage vB_BcoS-136 TaxID=2419619 RepID=A0A3G3BW46_9CAUD|nr:hypothetical protein PQE75_gp153 [Bacillus phage vB_BcoS-136]AYP68326.1 hypothetical protein vBBcoS136_00212 [Bacillus phage vB_BcoS-136]
MKNCTKHFLERWVERIVGITTEKERNTYITENREMIIEHANKTFEFSQFIYKGQIGDNVTRNYHIKDDIVFVTNTTDDAFITIYKVDLGFTEELNSTVRKGLITEIEKLRNEKEEIEFKILEEIEDKEHEVSSLQDQIKIMEEQLANLRKQKEFAEAEIKNVKSKSLNTGLELRKYTMMLVNSKEYKKDLTTMK